jgi:hypothetical protein
MGYNWQQVIMIKEKKCSEIVFLDEMNNDSLNEYVNSCSCDDSCHCDDGGYCDRCTCEDE